MRGSSTRGESCIAGKRFIVVDAIRHPFEERFVERMRAAKLGDPLNDETEIGPLARRDLRETLRRQVESSIARGARCLLGGSMPRGAGAYYPPTALTEVRKGMPAFDEELFGPVAAIVPVKDEADAIAAANDSSFGLGAAVITRDVRRGERIAADEIESGSVFVNDAVRSDQRLPFGGVKESGYGRAFQPTASRNSSISRPCWWRERRRCPDNGACARWRHGLARPGRTLQSSGRRGSCFFSPRGWRRCARREACFRAGYG